jgi:hypothetical protein
MSNIDKQSRFEDLAYWKNNAEENYMTTPISVLKYIHKLENHIETIKAQLPSDEGIQKEFKIGSLAFIDRAKWMRDKIQGGNK